MHHALLISLITLLSFFPWTVAADPSDDLEVLPEPVKLEPAQDTTETTAPTTPVAPLPPAIKEVPPTTESVEEQPTGERLGATSGLGLGVMIGSFNGLTLKNWLTGSDALSVGVTGNIGDRGDYLYVHLDYLRHEPLATSVTESRFSSFYGLGGVAYVQKRSDIGLRLPFGICYYIPDSPLDFFVELAPELIFAQDFNAALGGVLGMRSFF